MTRQVADGNVPERELDLENQDQLQELREAGPDYIVGVGASAGGLESLERMFKAMPYDTGMAFVVIQHLSPDFKSLMDELLARYTNLPIHRAEENMPVEANSIYLIPPKKEMIIADGRLLLRDKDPKSALTHADRSLLPLAGPGRGRPGIGVILSGTGSDGSRGIRDIHNAGGLVIAETRKPPNSTACPKPPWKQASSIR
jgi:two-component system, chemotaxis family, CheB/CheR fusion protein